MLLWSKGLNPRIFIYEIYFQFWNVRITCSFALVINIIVLKPTFDCNIECQYINIKNVAFKRVILGA